MALVRRPNILVVGTANCDVMTWERGVPGVSREPVKLPGGKGGNTATAAARLGAWVVLVARVGRDASGQDLAQSLERERVNCDHLVWDAEHPTGQSFIHVDASGERYIRSVRGANAHLSAADVWSAREAFAGADVVATQLHLPHEAISATRDIARSFYKPLVADAARSQPVPLELLVDLDILRANASEASALTGIPVTDRRSAACAAEWLRGCGVGTVIVGAPGGDWMSGPNGDHWLPYLELPVVDKTGAGDALVGAFCVGLGREYDLRQAFRLGRAASAIKCARVGAQAGLPRIGEVLAILHQVPDL